MSQKNLDTASTVLGLIAGVASLLGGTGVIDQQVAGTVGGIATAILGYLVNRPADKPV
ncbi:hypothetical protein NIES4106_39120 [Fischerella sp. NIES-4106]|nr:hypothetical protein NIES4106_39120 [Fischerella sp. NIES-4106]